MDYSITSKPGIFRGGTNITVSLGFSPQEKQIIAAHRMKDLIIAKARSDDTGSAVLRKNEKRLVREAADAERSAIIDNLTSEQEDKLNEAHAEHYHGTDDDMPDAFEGWLEDLSLDEIKRILA